MKELIKVYKRIRKGLLPSTFLTIGYLVVLILFKLFNIIDLSWWWIIGIPFVNDLIFSIFFALDVFCMDKALNINITYSTTFVETEAKEEAESDSE